MSEIKPFTKLVWRNLGSRKKWQKRIQRCSRAYMMSEVEAVVQGLRECTVYHTDVSEIPKVQDQMAEKDLIFLPVFYSKRYKGFSHRHEITTPDDPEAFCYGVVARDAKTAKIFKNAHLQNPINHKRIGELLSYPECCISFFEETWIAKHAIDPMFEIALNTEESHAEANKVVLDLHPYCNQLLRYFGLRITPHLPCSFQCKETIRWGKEWIRLIAEMDQDAANWILHLLSMPILWNNLHGIAILETPYFVGITNSQFELSKKIIFVNGNENSFVSRKFWMQQKSIHRKQQN